jgi:ATP-dependent Clp protease ATP-binding subunit ClpX
VSVLTKPKSALIKQFQKMFSLEGVDLTFTDDALLAIAGLALKRGSGARGLRAILEDILLDLMYDLPERTTLRRVIVDKDVVTDGKKPVQIHEDLKKSA